MEYWRERIRKGDFVRIDVIFAALLLFSVACATPVAGLPHEIGDSLTQLKAQLLTLKHQNASAVEMKAAVAATRAGIWASAWTVALQRMAEKMSARGW